MLSGGSADSASVTLLSDPVNSNNGESGEDGGGLLIPSTLHDGTIETPRFRWDIRTLGRKAVQFLIGVDDAVTRLVPWPAELLPAHLEANAASARMLTPIREAPVGSRLAGETALQSPIHPRSVERRVQPHQVVFNERTALRSSPNDTVPDSPFYSA